MSLNILQTRRLLLGRIRQRQYHKNVAYALFLWQRNGARAIIGTKAVESVGRVLRQTVLRLRRKSFAKWAMVYRRDRALENKLRHRRLLKRLRVLDVCWEEWYQEMEMGRGQLRLARHAAKKLTYEFRKRTFLKWRTNAIEKKKERVLLKRVAAKMLHKQIISCWNIWCEYVDEREYARRLAGRVFRRLVDGQVRNV